MSKNILCWVVYICVSLVLCVGVYKTTSESDNYATRPVPLTVVKMIQEDNKSSTTYRGVFQMENGRYIDFEVTPSDFVRFNNGDKVIYNLNKYTTLDATRTFPILGLLLYIGTAFFYYICWN